MQAKHLSRIEMIIIVVGAIVGIVSVMGVSGGIAYYFFDLKNRSLAQELSQNKQLDDEKIQSHQEQLTTSAGAVKYGVSDSVIYLKKDSFLIDPVEARKLVAKRTYIVRDNLIFPDFTSRGYDFHDGMRLKQVASYLKDHTIPLPEKDNPDDESDPLWWPKCWGYTIASDADQGQGEGEILICKMSRDQFDTIFSRASDMLATLNLKGLNIQPEGIPRPAKAFVVISTLAKDGALTLDSLHYQDQLFVCEGHFLIKGFAAKMDTYYFTFISFEDGNDIVTVYVGSGASDNKLDIREDETRGFIRDFRALR